MPDSNAKTAATYLAELNGNAQDVSDWVLDLAARCDAAEAKAEQRPRSPLSDEALGEVARKAERLAVARSGEPHVDACNSMAKAVREAIEASQAPAADEGAVVLADRASGDIAILSHHQNGSTVDSQRLWMAQQSATIISRYELTAWLIQPRVSWRLEDYDVWMSGAPDFVKALIRDA